MGMAAGQARLLSITARMSDNELRAQIINNDKMRLATESSQVSEHYVQALNEAELMFTNYDANNNASFKQLTYNALTAYNPYNNQYALTNASGNILLAETDYRNYTKSKDLEDFLECYGLKKTTTYFDYGNPLNDNLKTNNGSVVFTNPNVEDDTTTLINETTNQPTGFTAEQLKLAYMGIDKYEDLGGTLTSIDMTGLAGVKPQGYETTLNSFKYSEYMRYLEKYNQTKATFLESLGPIMQKTLDQMLDAQSGGKYKKLSDLQDAINSTDSKDTMKTYMEYLQELICGKSYGDYQTSSNNGNKTANSNNVILQNNSTEINNYYKTLWDQLQGNKDKNINKDYPLQIEHPNTTATVEQMKFTFEWAQDSNNEYKPTLRQIEILDDNNQTNKTINTYGNNNFSSGEIVDSEGKKHIIVTSYDGDKTYTISVTDIDANTIDNMRDVAKSVIKSLKNSVANCWDPMAGENTPPQATPIGIFTKQPPANTYYKEYYAAAIELGKVIYGSSYSGDNPPIDELGDAYVLYNAIGGTFPNPEDGETYGPYPEFDKDFYQVYLNIILDKVQDTYGEPHFTWIDTSAPTDSYNVNGEAKAKWYTNIWDMCEKNGCKALKNGLASSTEWIQFAFESGIVNLQQVDENNNWNSLIYSNCSDITTQTSDKMIAKAEAEYNAAMNKIENKDKRYDLELKNIDTEHNSLQIEYESIKNAIDKNIQRVFKIYS